MAKKSKKKAVIKKKFSKDINHLEVLLKFSLRAADDKSQVLRDIFNEQADKIRNKIKDLEKNQ